MPKKRAERGSVQVGECNGSLRLLWTYQGKRYSIALGLRDIPWHRKLAHERALWLNQELHYGRFDLDQLDQYRAFLHGEDVLLSALPRSKAPPLGQLWEQYTKVKIPSKSPATVRGYDWVTGHIARLPSEDMQQPQVILDAIALLRPNTQKKLLTQFNACAKWAQKSGLLTDNPFVGAASEVKIPKVGTAEDEIHPFSRTERDQIIQAFKQHRYYSHYTNLVTFLFFTGCRPSEAIPLQWRQVNADHILFDQGRVYTGKGYQTKPGLKTQQCRRFPLNDQLRDILAELERGDGAALVFPSPKGTYIDWSNFTNRAWKIVLAELPKISYRNPYQMRHSFVSHCAEAGIQPIVLADWIGNSLEMVNKVYARVTQKHQVPTL